MQLADTTAQTSVIDPNQLSPTFNVEQQLQAYYGFKSTLDIGHYDIDGHSQDVALAVRELRASGIPQSSWVNNHLVYTHGYGVVAAPTDRGGPRPPRARCSWTAGCRRASRSPSPGRRSTSGRRSAHRRTRSWVSRPAATNSWSSTTPVATARRRRRTRPIRVDGGIPIGSTLRRLLFAVQQHDPNILFSSELNSASQLLTVRDPRARVAKVAPWLTLDGDVYPAVVNGDIKWIVDGYTTSSNYPDSQLVNLHAASRTTLTANGASVAQPNTQVNYLQNSVKAVVDAYTGKVTLYEWNQKQHPDPLLKDVGIGLPRPGPAAVQHPVGPAAPAALPHGPVQRPALPAGEVPRDAAGELLQRQRLLDGTDATRRSRPPGDQRDGYSHRRRAHRCPRGTCSMSADGFGAQRYSLSSPMVTLNGQQLAAFVSVDAQPGPDYGKFTVLNFPSASGGESPAQVQNDIESDTDITEALTLQRGGNSNVVLGDLEAIPVAGRMLYVEPVYTQSSGSASFPILRHVIALYANGDPSFDRHPRGRRSRTPSNRRPAPPDRRSSTGVVRPSAGSDPPGVEQLRVDGGLHL